MDLSRIITITKKELILKLRFKWGYIFSSIVNPIKWIILFFFMYSGFFYSGAENIGGVTKTNYLVFLLIGMNLANLFNSGFKMIGDYFLREKYWQTIQGLLVSPAKKREIILGFGIGALIDILPIFLVSMALAYIIMPIGFLNLLYALLLMVPTYLIILGFGFINAAFHLSDENWSALFQIVYWGTLVLSCFYYPIESLPGFLHIFVRLNPLYIANFAIKSFWIGGSFGIKRLIGLIVLAIISLSVGSYIFNKVWKKIGIQGY